MKPCPCCHQHLHLPEDEGKAALHALTHLLDHLLIDLLNMTHARLPEGPYWEVSQMALEPFLCWESVADAMAHFLDEYIEDTLKPSEIFSFVLAISGQLGPFPDNIVEAPRDYRKLSEEWLRRRFPGVSIPWSRHRS